jgi:Xaa-Pro dipeptidase
MKPRIERIQRKMSELGIETLILAKPSNTMYASGFRALDYTRWVITVVPAEKEPLLIVPKLDEAAAKDGGWIREVRAYVEVPGNTARGIKGILKDERGAFFTGSYDIWPKEDPFDLLVDAIREKNLDKSVIGIEKDYLPIKYYDFLRKQLSDASFRDGGEVIAQMRMIKSEEEVELMRKAARLTVVALKAALETAGAGVSEFALDGAGDEAIRKEVAEKIAGHTVELLVGLTLSGPKTYKPHQCSSSRILQKGDLAVHIRQDIVDGYAAECERTFFIGQPDKSMARAFNASADAQQAAIEIMKPGVTAEEADKAAREVRKKVGYGPETWGGHRTGHGMGLEYHESPYLRDLDKTILRPGMTFAVEPGIYISGLGGFRHSDTVLITEGGCEILTEYPRDLKSLVIER